MDRNTRRGAIAAAVALLFGGMMTAASVAVHYDPPARSFAVPQQSAVRSPAASSQAASPNPSATTSKPPQPEPVFVVGGGYAGGYAIDLAVALAVGDVDNLRAWWLCAAELSYGEQVYLAMADSFIPYSLHEPWHGSDWFTHRVGQAGWKYEMAKIMHKAAELAAKHNLPCLPPYDVTVKRIVKLTIPADGEMKTAYVPDYAVVLPLEDAIVEGECLVRLEAHYAAITDLRLTHGFSAQDKQRSLDLLAARLNLLRTTGVGRTC